MADIEVIKCVCQLNGCLVIRYQVFMMNLILFFDLIGNQLGVTVGLKISYPHLSGKLEADKQSIVLNHIIGIRFC